MSGRRDFAAWRAETEELARQYDGLAAQAFCWGLVSGSGFRHELPESATVREVYAALGLVEPVTVTEVIDALDRAES